MRQRHDIGFRRRTSEIIPVWRRGQGRRRKRSLISQEYPLVPFLNNSLLYFYLFHHLYRHLLMPHPLPHPRYHMNRLAYLMGLSVTKSSCFLTIYAAISKEVGADNKRPKTCLLLGKFERKSWWSHKYANFSGSLFAFRIIWHGIEIRAWNKLKR